MLRSVELKKFTVFEDARVDFSPGINVFLGANATGKTHAMKLFYGLLRAWKNFESGEPGVQRRPSSQLGEVIKAKLAAVFRPDDGKVGRLVRRGRGKSKSSVDLMITGGRIGFTMSNQGNVNIVNRDSTDIPASIFLPAREVLSIYPGFLAAYQNRELAFDETYYDICLALSGSPLRGPRGEAASALWRPLGDHLRANVSLEGNTFYVSSEEDGIIEAHLVAEGFRKIASLMHLIANGSLMKNAILFWDEPEANLNPKLIKIVADFLLGLAVGGVQIVIATHDYLLTNELSLQAEYQTEEVQRAPIQFFSFYRAEDHSVGIQQGDTLADLRQNPIMEEFEALYNREQCLFQQEQPITIPGNT